MHVRVQDQVQDKTKQEITSAPASLADWMSEPSLGPISRILLTSLSHSHEIQLPHEVLHSGSLLKEGTSPAEVKGTSSPACWGSSQAEEGQHVQLEAQAEIQLFCREACYQHC